MALRDVQVHCTRVRQYLYPPVPDDLNHEFPRLEVLDSRWLEIHTFKTQENPESKSDFDGVPQLSRIFPQFDHEARNTDLIIAFE
jgi:hypothetical protein